MHIVESGKRYRIFNNAITTYDQLPPKTYRVDYDPETRIFSLLEAHDFEIPETKIYGQHLDKVKKVCNSLMIFINQYNRYPFFSCFQS